jgi:23S rRNA (guanosine2251-2'-O)-methyltransferase
MSHQLTKSQIRSRKSGREDFASAPRLTVRFILDSLKVAANVGTILRLSDAIMAEHVYICGATIQPPNHKLKQASIGAERWVSWSYHEYVREAVRDAREKGHRICAVEWTTASRSLFDARFAHAPYTFVLGREFDGVNEEILHMADECIHVPMHGMCNSLNVSSAAAIVGYEYYRQRQVGSTAEESSHLPRLLSQLG